MKLIDTHTHLFSEQFNEDVEIVIQNALNAGVQQMLMPNVDLNSAERMHAIADKYLGVCLPMMGLHPCSVGADFEMDLQKILSYFPQRKYCAVGEIGIDLYWDKTFISQQKEAFSQQIIFAKEHKLPVVIHVRESFDEVFDVIDSLHDSSLSGVFHCFTGNAEQAKKVMEYETFMMGIGGVLTFKKSGLDIVVKDIPIEFLVLETDSPYLAPTPHRGKRNESSYLTLILEKLAEVKGLLKEEVASITTANAKKLFSL